MSGVPTGHDIRSVQSIAEALGIDWDESTFERFLILQSAWLKNQIREQEAREREHTHTS